MMFRVCYISPKFVKFGIDFEFMDFLWMDKEWLKFFILPQLWWYLLDPQYLKGFEPLQKAELNDRKEPKKSV